MNEPELDIPEEFYAYKSRAARYIARLSGFPFQWALPDSPKTDTGFPTRFFRWDQRRFKRLIEHAEHLIRCLIIWMAYARLRSGLIKDGSFSLLGNSPERDPSRRRSRSGWSDENSPERVLCEPRSREQIKDVHQQSAGAERPEPQAMEPRSSITSKDLPIHPYFVLRGLPLYDQKVPAFRVSLPSPPGRGAGGEGLNSFHSPHPKSLSPEERDFFGHSPERALCEQKANESKSSPERALCEPKARESKRRLRPRNDTIYTCDRLIARMERLGTLIEEIDTRADRIAGIWLARMQKSELSRSPKRASGTQKTNVLDSGSSPGKANGGSRLSNDTPWHPIPIKSPDPPPDILQDASDEERDDLLALHDAAIRAAELFSQHCG